MSYPIKRIQAGLNGAIIHVNRQVIASNAKNGEDKPVFTIKPNGQHSTAIYARAYCILGKSYGVAGGHLSCGARAWIEVPAGVEIDLTDPMSYPEMKRL